MTTERITPACNICIEDDLDVGIWTATRDFEPRRISDCIRSALEHLEGHWAYELHQFLANSGNTAMLYRLNQDEDGAMPLSMGAARGPFGHGLLLETAVSSGERIQLGISMLTAFAVTLSQGTDPHDVRVEDLGQQIRNLQLPVA